MASSVRIVFNHFPQLAAATREAGASAADDLAGQIAAGASSRAVRRTGFMASSAYVVSAKRNTYGQTQGAGPLLPMVAKPAGDTTAVAAMGAAYSAYVNYGTSRMGAQPFWEPAVGFVQALAESTVVRWLTRAWEKAGGHVG